MFLYSAFLWGGGAVLSACCGAGWGSPPPWVVVGTIYPTVVVFDTVVCQGRVLAPHLAARLLGVVETPPLPAAWDCVQTLVLPCQSMISVFNNLFNSCFFFYIDGVEGKGVEWLCFYLVKPLCCIFIIFLNEKCYINKVCLCDWTLFLAATSLKLQRQFSPVFQGQSQNKPLNKNFYQMSVNTIKIKKTSETFYTRIAKLIWIFLFVNLKQICITCTTSLCPHLLTSIFLLLGWTWYVRF